MNARLQVEHPVTELVTGLDLVELQLLVAAGARLPLDQASIGMRGHAIEARVNAEDVRRGFLPSSGRVLAYRRPAAARVDDAIEAGSVVGTDYDSMLGKVIAHGADRESALARLDRALAETAILGVTTNVSFVRALLATDEVRTGAIDTGLIGRIELGDPHVAPAEVAGVAALIQTAVNAERASDDPFSRVDGWRVSGVPGWSWWRLAVDGGAPSDIRVRGLGEYDAGDGPVQAVVTREDGDAFAVSVGGIRRTWAYAFDGDTMWLARDGSAWRVRRASSEESSDAAVHGDLRAPMPGQVLLVHVEEGQSVKAGDPVIVMESMKMELTIAAPVDGVIKGISVTRGDMVALDQPLAHVGKP
jgi:acetyl-CoA/propionyl-CoA carboxylase biotin carboxyl carrier protein